MADGAQRLEDEETQYFILTSSGKPVYALHGADEKIAEYDAILQALVACFEVDKDELRSFRSTNTLFVFKCAPPLILVAIDKLAQSEGQLTADLDLLHAQILSTLTQSQLARAFEKNSRIDLRPLLGGTEVFLDALTSRMVHADPALWLGALETLPLDKAVRAQASAALIEFRTQDMLYGLLVAGGKLVSIARPRQHSLHPSDLHLVFSMLFNTTSFSEGEHWSPICLPKFNSRGFLYAYVHFLAEKTAVVLISPDRNGFFAMQDICNKATARLNDNNCLDKIVQAAAADRLTPGDMNAPLIQHAVYKSQPNVQFVQTSLESVPAAVPGAGLDSNCPDIMHEYRTLQAFMQEQNLRVAHVQKEGASFIGWITPSFEIYCTAPSATKTALNDSLREMIWWIRGHEDRLFITVGATF